MSHSRILTLLACLIFSGATGGIPSLNGAEVSYELDSNYSYGGGARTDFGNGRTGAVSEQSSLLRCVVSPQLTPVVLLRLGVEWQRYSFGLPSQAPLPNTLQSISLVVGADVQLSESWLLRVEAQPGFYGDNSALSARTFNVPVIVGASYLAGSDLQWILGMRIDLNGLYPVLPCAGVRWRFANQWVLDAILPTPRLEYEFSKQLTLYGGMDLRDSTYRVDGQFGTANRNRRLNSAIVDYLEVRAGAGATWKIHRNVTIELEAGYIPYREFDFQRAGFKAETRDGAPYGQIAISSRF